MTKPFKLRATLFGHSLDVRSVTVNFNNEIVSGSRDKTAKLWVGNSGNQDYREAMTFRDQKNFVASVLYLDPSVEFPTGLIITGGNDNTILCYKPHEPFATLSFKEHTNVVCKLVKGIQPNSFLSASWDATAKLWVLNKTQSISTYSGHIASVWSVIQLQNGNVVTASADKTIGIFSKDGYRIKTLQGHTDCIRDLADFPELNYFISVANDATIRVWGYSGDCLHTYYGHTNYIYSVSRNVAGGMDCFVTSDEDRTVRYWKDGVNTETFYLPAQSVWSVSCLSNGDIVTGSSDGIVRVFTQDETNFTNEESLKLFNESVHKFTEQCTREIGGYKVSDLPGREALYEPGKRHGQMKMIREAQGVIAYTWVEEGEDGRWEKVGDVLGGVSDTDSKTTYEGKTYDFVFTVDVEDGKPPLKLPYNKGEDPYVVAHNFLQKNMLPPTYLDQIVEFILKNSGASNELQPSNSTFVDPYTGGSRYTPATGTSTSVNRAATNLDPFTGDQSYSTSQKQSSYMISNGSDYFPQNEYRTFDQGDPNLILKKLKEFNMNAKANSVSEEYLENLMVLCSGPATDTESFATLIQLLNWNDEFVFPILDILKLAVRDKENNSKICSSENKSIIEKLIYYSSENCTVPSCTLVAFRTLCNLFAHPPGQQQVYEYRMSFLDNIASLTLANDNIQIALATFLLNMTILCIKHKDEVGIVLLCNMLPEVAIRMDNSEAEFRILVAVGTLLSLKSFAFTVHVKDNASFMKKLVAISEHSNNSDLKLQKCAAQILALINSM